MLYEEQMREITTIKERNVIINLSDADCERLSRMCGRHGATVSELLENFIGDLVYGTYANGSDEHNIATAWLDRCYLGLQDETTFLRFLIEQGRIDDAADALEEIEVIERVTANEEEFLASGEQKRGERIYTWKDIVKGDGTPFYASKEEWEKDARAAMQEEKERLADCKAVIDGCWNAYLESLKNRRECRIESMDEELEIVRNWIEDREKLQSPVRCNERNLRRQTR